MPRNPRLGFFPRRAAALPGDILPICGAATFEHTLDP